MEIVSDVDQLGPPALTIAGLRLWVYGRQFPDSQDYYDGNWLNVTAVCAGDGANVQTGGNLILAQDIEGFCAGCESLLRLGKGEASLSPCEPELAVKIASTDNLGHLRAVVEITPNNMTQEHRFIFEADQTYLQPIISQCKAILVEYPVRGTEPGRGGG
jgi:hypothetical protein